MTAVSWLGVAVVVVASLAVYWVYFRRARSGFYEELGPNQTVGLEPGEHVVGAWRCERYFGPLVSGSERTAGSWLSWLFWNAIPGRHWLTVQPLLALHGAPLWVRLTDRGRLVVTIARGWSRSLRPRVSYLSPLRRGFEPLLACGPEVRAIVRTGSEAFPGRSPGHFNRPEREFLGFEELSELVVIDPQAEAPLVAWCEPEAVPALKVWSGGGPSPR
jgi:hypothetical protein